MQYFDCFRSDSNEQGGDADDWPAFEDDSWSAEEMLESGLGGASEQYEEDLPSGERTEKRKSKGKSNDERVGGVTRNVIE
jgi:hypothetical protein